MAIFYPISYHYCNPLLPYCGPLLPYFLPLLQPSSTPTAVLFYPIFYHYCGPLLPYFLPLFQPPSALFFTTIAALFYPIFYHYCSPLLPYSQKCCLLFFLEIHQHASSTNCSNDANLSNLKLSSEHHKFLQLRLSSYPTPKFIDSSKISHDNEHFCRCLCPHKNFFSNGDAKNLLHNNNHRKLGSIRWGNEFINLLENYAKNLDNNFISNTPHKVTIPTLPEATATSPWRLT